MENIYRAEHAMKQPVCVMCGVAYAEDNSPACHRCYVEEMLAQIEADEWRAEHHYGQRLAK